MIEYVTGKHKNWFSSISFIHPQFKLLKLVGKLWQSMYHLTYLTEKYFLVRDI